jgi:RHS repeat-associated protein
MAQSPEWGTGAFHLNAELSVTSVGSRSSVTVRNRPGQYHDAATDLFQNWNRFYDPAIGRYLELEPILAQPGRATVYSYAAGNPLSFIDRTGLYIFVTVSSFPIRTVGRLRGTLGIRKLRARFLSRALVDVRAVYASLKPILGIRSSKATSHGERLPIGVETARRTACRLGVTRQCT